MLPRRALTASQRTRRSSCRHRIGDASARVPPRPLTTCGSACHRGRGPSRPGAEGGGFRTSFLSAHRLDALALRHEEGSDGRQGDEPRHRCVARTGVAGGETRFQVFARLHRPDRHGSASRSRRRPRADGLSWCRWTSRLPAPTGMSVSAHEMYGIGFDGHPDLRNIYLPATSRATRCARTSRCWPAWSSRGPASSTSSRCPAGRGRRRVGRLVTIISDRHQLVYIACAGRRRPLNVELETEGMTLNIGPQHPATHGTLRIIARSMASRSSGLTRSAGYMHRGYEKLTEVRTFPQVTTLINRIDWLGSFANEVPVHPCRREADGDRGATARPVHPHDPLRDAPDRQRLAFPRRPRRADGRVTPVFLPSATASTSST